MRGLQVAGGITEQGVFRESCSLGPGKLGIPDVPKHVWLQSTLGNPKHRFSKNHRTQEGLRSRQKRKGRPLRMQISQVSRELKRNTTQASLESSIRD